MADRIIDRPHIHMPNEAHVALTLVLDVSGSMQGDAINSLNAAVNKMITEMKADEHLSHIVDLAIFVFGTHGRQNIYQGFRAIADCGTVRMEAKDVNTYVVKALEQAVELTRNRCIAYNNAGGSYKPWIVLITDGEFHDDEGELNRIGDIMRKREQSNKLHFFGLGIDGYVRSQLEKFTNDPNHVIGASEADFAEFFSWIGKSMSAISNKKTEGYVDLPTIQHNVLD